MKFNKSYFVLLAVISTALSANAYASPKMLSGYDQLVQALHNGDDVHAIISYDKCKAEGASKLTISSVGRVNFNIFSHYQVQDHGTLRLAVATSMTMFTEHNVLGPINAYGRLRVFEDNTAEFHAAYYDPKTYELKGMVNYICKIATGNSEDNAIKLYDSSL